ncbi:CBN-RPB-12 protein [Caenorhabditis brenneri]|uniref:CBN-RPB-12 protein n=1 Tax=Caenorhabditis brenneri TaxID=135651 RepID=G0NMM2_CAEBE|nr:CBN-RPB-12 protein [Caenorhabditis brenneri]
MDGSATPGPGQAHVKSNSMIYICGVMVYDAR